MSHNSLKNTDKNTRQEHTYIKGHVAQHTWLHSVNAEIIQPPQKQKRRHKAVMVEINTPVFTLNSSPPGWVSTKGGRGERGEAGRRWMWRGGVSVEGITLPNPLWRPRLGALSVAAGANTQRGCRSPWGDSQAPASLPLSSVRLSASPSSNLPGGNLLPASTFFLPPLPPGGAGEVVLKGTPRQGQGSIGVGA